MTAPPARLPRRLCALIILGSSAALWAAILVLALVAWGAIQ
jgi:hypothetical protein